jgi:uncharacterized protein YecE (DUF72 family)
VKLFAGTSGYAFKEWKGSFYPDDLKDEGMLGYYAGRFPAVEINNTFYRLPREHVLQGWAAQVPDSFTFAIKASQRITHHARLKPECASAVEFLLRTTICLAERCGPILFQLPPNLKKDAGRLRAFLDTLPAGRRYTIEFRHESWFDDEVYETLKARDQALCIADHDDFQTPVITTAAWAYARLHRLTYDDAAIGAWSERLEALPVEELYVFFKHDETAGSGPSAAEAFTRAAASQ